jgi:hypothetical protein
MPELPDRDAWFVRRLEFKVNEMTFQATHYCTIELGANEDAQHQVVLRWKASVTGDEIGMVVALKRLVHQSAGPGHELRARWHAAEGVLRWTGSHGTLEELEPVWEAMQRLRQGARNG